MVAAALLVTTFIIYPGPLVNSATAAARTLLPG
jgi:hypothetical protein